MLIFWLRALIWLMGVTRRTETLVCLDAIRRIREAGSSTYHLGGHSTNKVHGRSGTYYRIDYVSPCDIAPSLLGAYGQFGYRVTIENREICFVVADRPTIYGDSPSLRPRWTTQAQAAQIA